MYEIRKTTFPYKLHQMLSTVSLDVGNETAPVIWLPHGQAFLIINATQFEKMLPLFFKQSKMRSFTRQLNLWGFKRCVVVSGAQSMAWLFNSAFDLSFVASLL